MLRAMLPGLLIIACWVLLILYWNISARSIDDHHHGPAQRAAGVELFPEADELDAKAIEFVRHLQKVASAAGQPVAGPHEHDIELPAPGVGHHLIQARPPGAGAGDAVGVALHDLEATLLGHGFQVEQLGFGCWSTVETRV